MVSGEWANFVNLSSLIVNRSSFLLQRYCKGETRCHLLSLIVIYCHLLSNNIAQCIVDEREIKYFDFRTFGAAAPRLRRERRASEGSIGRACDNTPVSSRAERGIPRRDFATYTARFFATLKMTRLINSKTQKTYELTLNHSCHPEQGEGSLTPFEMTRNLKLKNSKNHNSQLVTHNFFHTCIMRGRHARAQVVGRQ